MRLPKKTKETKKENPHTYGIAPVEISMCSKSELGSLAWLFLESWQPSIGQHNPLTTLWSITIFTLSASPALQGQRNNTVM